MSEARAARLLTAEEFAALPDNGMRQELIAGEVVEMPPAFPGHGLVCARIMVPLGGWVDANKLGLSLLNDPGVILARGPDTVRAPDGAFYAAARGVEPGFTQYLDTPPDLVVEVVSEHDRRGEVLAKVAQWLLAGVQMAVVAWPRRAQITVFGPGDEITLLGRGDTLTCEALLPGFALAVDAIFPI
ncbi:MAG: Uma2 family endonuclease [Armatimonadetes bacterium]|nr:Uma2 family endonuclease [Armatimonadota bacterium]